MYSRHIREILSVPRQVRNVKKLGQAFIVDPEFAIVVLQHINQLNDQHETSYGLLVREIVFQLRLKFARPALQIGRAVRPSPPHAIPRVLQFDQSLVG